MSVVKHSDSFIHVHTSIVFQIIFPGRVSHRILRRVLPALPQVPVDQSFHIPQGAYANPKPPVPPSPTICPFGNHNFLKDILNYPLKF